MPQCTSTLYLSSTTIKRKIKKIDEGKWKREINGGNEPNWGTIYICMEMSNESSVLLSYTNKSVFF